MSKSEDEGYPEFTSLDELIDLKVLADKFGVKYPTARRWRFGDPPLPYIRFNQKLYVAIPQVIWWLNRFQREVPDSYLVDRKRRLAAGIKVAQKKEHA